MSNIYIAKLTVGDLRAGQTYEIDATDPRLDEWLQVGYLEKVKAADAGDTEPDSLPDATEPDSDTETKAEKAARLKAEKAAVRTGTPDLPE